MQDLRSSSIVRRLILPFALLFWLSACQHWVELEPPYGPAIKAPDSKQLRVTADGQRTVYKTTLTVKGDTLWAGGDVIPLASLEKVDVRKANIAGTVLIVVPVAALIAFSVAYTSAINEPGY